MSTILIFPCFEKPKYSFNYFPIKHWDFHGHRGHPPLSSMLFLLKSPFIDDVLWCSRILLDVFVYFPSFSMFFHIFWCFSMFFPLKPPFSSKICHRWSPKVPSSGQELRRVLSCGESKDLLEVPGGDKYIYIWTIVKTPAILNMYSTDIGLWKLMEIVKNTR